MYLHGVEAGFPCQVDSPSVGPGHLRQLFSLHATHECRRIEIETGRGRNGSGSANLFMGHISAVPYLDACCRTFRVYSSGHFT